MGSLPAPLECPPQPRAKQTANAIPTMTCRMGPPSPEAPEHYRVGVFRTRRSAKGQGASGLVLFRARRRFFGFVGRTVQPLGQGLRVNAELLGGVALVPL